jgi:hypothetical protein
MTTTVRIDKPAWINKPQASAPRLLGEEWMGLLEFAESIGYYVPPKGAHYPGNFGTWVRTFASQLTNRKDQRRQGRFVHQVWVYPVHIPAVREELIKQINAYRVCSNPNKAIKERKSKK